MQLTNEINETLKKVIKDSDKWCEGIQTGVDEIHHLKFMMEYPEIASYTVETTWEYDDNSYDWNHQTIHISFVSPESERQLALKLQLVTPEDLEDVNPDEFMDLDIWEWEDKLEIGPSLPFPEIKGAVTTMKRPQGNFAEAFEHVYQKLCNYMHGLRDDIRPLLEIR